MKSRPWIWIVIAFLMFIGVLVTLVVIAEKNKQATVPLETVNEP